MLLPADQINAIGGTPDSPLDHLADLHVDGFRPVTGGSNPHRDLGYPPGTRGLAPRIGKEETSDPLPNVAA